MEDWFWLKLVLCMRNAGNRFSDVSWKGVRGWERGREEAVMDEMCVGGDVGG